MENILVLAHTEADGSLGKAGLEALATALSLGGALTVGLVGAATAGGRRPDRLLRRGALPRRHRRRVRPTALRHRCGRRRSPLPRGGLPDRDRRRHFALGARPARSGLPPGRPRGHPRHQSGAGQRRACGDSLVLPAAHGSRAHPHPASLVRAARSRLRGPLDRRARHRDRRSRQRRTSRHAHHGHGLSGAQGRRADHPPGRQNAPRRRRRLDQEAGRWRGPRRRSGAVDPRLPAQGAGLARRQQERWWT